LKYLPFYLREAFSKENEIVCSQFIGKQIIANADLDLLSVSFKQKSKGVCFFLILAYLALALTLGITIWQECNNTTDKRFAQIQNQLLQIEQTLKENAFDETVLDDLEGKLKEIELVIVDLSAGKNDVEK